MGGRSLPEDLIKVVLLELPAISLSRCKTVCKSWYSLINHPDFIKLHLHKSYSLISRHKFLIVKLEETLPLTYSIKIQSIEAPVSVYSKILSVDSQYIPGFYSEKDRYIQARSCDGLVIMHHPGNTMILWNPAIRKYKLIPKPDTPLPRPLWIVTQVGLSYDVVSEDYKVLCIHVFDKKHRPRHIVDLYSVKKQAWRRIDDFPVPDGFELEFGGTVSLNGTINIMATSSKGNRIISFYVADEKFIVTPVPSALGSGLEGLFMKLCAFGDRVCVSGHVGEEISIWSLEKDVKTGLLTWSNIIKFRDLGPVMGMKPGQAGNIVCFKENGNVLWQKYGDDSFVEYDVLEKKYTELYVKEILPNLTFMPKLYVESLASLKIPWD